MGSLDIERAILELSHDSGYASRRVEELTDTLSKRVWMKYIPLIGKRVYGFWHGQEISELETYSKTLSTTKDRLAQFTAAKAGQQNLIDQAEAA